MSYLSKKIILNTFTLFINFSLECTTECAKTERNRRIALALQIRNPDLSPNVTPRYSDFMKEFAKKDVSFCNNIHEKLANLVTNAKQVSTY